MDLLQHICLLPKVLEMTVSELAFHAHLFAQLLSKALDQETWEKICDNTLLEEWFSHSSTSVLEDWSMVASDFTYLFICDEMFLKAPPYGSFYLEKTGELFSKESEVVEAFYAQFNFHSKLLPTEPADHMAVELEFLSHLLTSVSQNKAFEVYLNIFVEKNLAPWLFSWCNDLKNNAQTNFYRALAYHIAEYGQRILETFHINVQTRTIYRKAS